MPRYDVCLSFASEDREYVDAVARALRPRGVKVFYDSFETVSLWGKDLPAHLDEIYRESARFCVLFASEHYRRKGWPNLERRSIQARVLVQEDEYLLPARFDDTVIPGIPNTIGYVDLRLVSSLELADMICDKLRSPLDVDVLTPPLESFRFMEPISFEISGQRVNVARFQSVAVGSDAEALQAFAENIVDRITSLVRTDSNGRIYWSHFEDRRFDRIHATSSVVTALLQCGASSRSSLVRLSLDYLDDTDAGSVDDRPATIVRLWLARLSEDDALNFIDLLARRQVPPIEGDAGGSFLFAQGPELDAGSVPSNWEPRRHVGGFTFHACHIADTLLHVPPVYSRARYAAAPLLQGLRTFLARMLYANDGWLIDSQGRRTAQTVYGLSLCSALSIPLPANWRDVAGEALTGVRHQFDDVASRSFRLMNALYLVRATRDVDFEEFAAAHASAELSTLIGDSAFGELSALNLSLLMRGINSALRLIDAELPRGFESSVRRHVDATTFTTGN